MVYHNSNLFFAEMVYHFSFVNVLLMFFKTNVIILVLYCTAIFSLTLKHLSSNCSIFFSVSRGPLNGRHSCPGSLPSLGQLFKPPFTQFLLLCRGLWHCSLILFLANKPRQITTAPGVGRLCGPTASTAFPKPQHPFSFGSHAFHSTNDPCCWSSRVAWLRNRL